MCSSLSWASTSPPPWSPSSIPAPLQSSLHQPVIFLKHSEIPSLLPLSLQGPAIIVRINSHIFTPAFEAGWEPAQPSLCSISWLSPLSPQWPLDVLQASPTPPRPALGVYPQHNPWAWVPHLKRWEKPEVPSSYGGCEDLVNIEKAPKWCPAHTKQYLSVSYHFVVFVIVSLLRNVQEECILIVLSLGYLGGTNKWAQGGYVFMWRDRFFVTGGILVSWRSEQNSFNLMSRD